MEHLRLCEHAALPGQPEQHAQRNELLVGAPIRAVVVFDQSAASPKVAGGAEQQAPGALAVAVQRNRESGRLGQIVRVDMQLDLVERADFPVIIVFYGLDVVVIPTNKPMIRIDQADVIYKTEKEKVSAI